MSWIETRSVRSALLYCLQKHYRVELDVLCSILGLPGSSRKVVHAGMIEKHMPLSTHWIEQQPDTAALAALASSPTQTCIERWWSAVD